MNSKTVTQKLHQRAEADYLRQTVTVLFLLALLFLVAGVVVFVTRAQNPNCVDLKRRLDDATRAYQTVLMTAETGDRQVASYQALVIRLQSDLLMNDKRREQAEKDLVRARTDRMRCERHPDMLPAGDCASLTQRIGTAEKIIAYAKANQKKLEADLTANRQRLATVKATLAATNASLTSAQQDLDAANQAYATAGCANDKR